MFAQATILGNLGRNPEIRIVGQNNKVASFSLAVNEKRQNQEITHWFYVSAWGPLADLCEKYVMKGSRILIQGRLTTRSYTDKDNILRNVTEVVADKIELINTPREEGQNNAPTASAPAPASEPKPVPTGAAHRPGIDDPLPGDDDNDLPF